MVNQTPKKIRDTRLRYIFIVVGATAIAFIAMCLVSPYGCRICSLLINKRSYTRAHVVTEKNWAQHLGIPGVPNLHKVSDDLYRGAQPTAEGMRQLKKLGIKTIVNLRSFHSDRDEIEDTGLAYEHIYMKTWHPEDEQVVRFLQIVTDSNCIPVFVHCQRGADRTGVMCAIYRIAVQSWSKADAIEEMTEGSFGFFFGWQNLVEYIRGVDIDNIKRLAGLNSQNKTESASSMSAAESSTHPVQIIAKRLMC